MIAGSKLIVYFCLQQIEQNIEILINNIIYIYNCNLSPRTEKLEKFDNMEKVFEHAFKTKDSLGLSWEMFLFRSRQALLGRLRQFCEVDGHNFSSRARSARALNAHSP